MKIETLVEDIQHVIKTGEGWTDEISQWVSQEISKSLIRQLSPRNSPTGKGSLRPSNLGTPCERKLWYTVNTPRVGEPLPYHTLNKFIFGDITECYLLGLVKASGHKLEGLQGEVYVDGLTGSMDCIIDGVLVDVKSASSMAFKKFSSGNLREEDPFGYIAQLSTYLYGSKDNPQVVDKNRAAFLVMDKTLGHICLDMYDLEEEVSNKPKEVAQKKEMVSGEMPEKGFSDVPFQKSGNRKLGTFCSYCDFKNSCWSELRTFIYSNGPVHLTHVEKEPSSSIYEVTQGKKPEYKF